MAEYNYAKLLGRMRERGVTQEDVASKMGRNAATISRKLNNQGYFTQTEISIMCDILKISDEEIGNYFFAK